MSLLNPWGLLLLLLAIPILVMHILKPRREERAVGSTFLWERMEQPVTATAPWQRLRPSWLLLAQLLAVVLAALLVADPARVTEAPLAQHTVFLIDGSGSMQALDGEPDRLAAAKARAVERRAELPDGGVASVIEVGPVPRVLLTTNADAQAFADAVARARSTNGSADFAAAFALAEGLETPDAPIGFVLVSDGGLTDEELRLVPTGLTYEAIGSMSTNRAITDLSVEPAAVGVTARVTIEHTGGPTATQTLRVDVDGRTAFSGGVTLQPGDRTVVDVSLPAGDRVEAFLEGDDLLALDDRRWAVTARRAALDIAVVGAGDPFLLAMLDSVDGASVSRYASFETYESASESALDAADLLIFDQVAVPDDPGAPFLAIAAPGGLPGVTVDGLVELPVITLVRSEDQLLRDLDLTAVGIAEAQRLETSGVDTLVAAESAPLVVRGTHSGRPFVYLAFPISQSNLPVQLAFPILGDRLVTELGGAALPPTDLVVGGPVRFPGASAVITDPGGNDQQVRAGDVVPVAERPGFWTITPPDGPSQVVAVNPDTSESTLAPAPAVPSEIRTARAGEEPPRNQDSWRPWLIAALLAVLVVEWFLARTRVGVVPRQWTIAQGARLAIAAALVVALFQPGIDRAQDTVATVFVVDASDSLGTSGRSDAVAFVREALADPPDDAVAGVVLFGGDARIESLVQEDLDLDRPAVVVDPSRTNLAAAIRLGAAILPTDARRRVVLVSDGRATTGDVIAEAQRLAADGVAVDTRVVGGGADRDVAVAAVDAPSFARDGEAIPVEATLVALAPGDAVVTLLRDGDLVDAVSVALVEGDNRLSFVDAEPPPGLHRYEVHVSGTNDPVPQNDRGYVPVQIGDANGVLVIEGADGAGQAIAAALVAGGTPVTVDDVTGIGSVDDLVAYDAVVLVDVPAWEMTAAQATALTTAVRDTGRGLVTIGGVQSFGVGGYLGSELETVLPVVSDVLDPKRRQTVAEVLAIDTSGSMGACHCAEGAMGEGRTPGGVSKTEIAAAGAARAIAALGASDEVGVVAFDVQNRWVVDLQPLPPADEVSDGLGSLTPNGGTNLLDTLETAAAELRGSTATLRHIILFTDGFTAPGALDEVADQAAALFADEGITTSVIATGEGAAEELRPIAEAGGGRFYPGRDLDRIPQIILEEAVQAARDFIVEGEFLPLIASADAAVRNLTESPPLFGYVASTTKPTASTLLRIGPDGDPLLASWQVGLGTSTAWTSDASDRWSQQWATWDGYVDFWTRVVRDTFPSPSGSVETRARVTGDLVRIEVDSEDVFMDGSVAVARLTDPTGEAREVPLDRVSDRTWAAEVAIETEGTWAVGTAVTNPDGSSINGTALVSRAYSFEYRPGSPDVALMERLASVTGGRAEVAAEAAFDKADLAQGSRRFEITPWLLLFAALLWPIAVALSRIRLRRGPLATTAGVPTAADRNAALSTRRRSSLEAAEELDRSSSSSPSSDPRPPADGAGAATPPGFRPVSLRTDYPDTMPQAGPAPSTNARAGVSRDAGDPDDAAGDATDTDTTDTADTTDGGTTLDALLARKRTRDQG